ncbi:MAG TPA: CRTAC1 family protein [Gemmatimonadaceae bacterium]
MKISIKRVALLFSLSLVAPSGCRTPDVAPVVVPAWMLERGRVQAGLAGMSPTYHGFRFTDQIDASGITFTYRAVDDAGRDYKAVHYDHGSGVCAADVDGDGRPDLFFVTQLGSSQLWRNLGGGRFENITEAAGLSSPDAIGVGCAFADIDNDGRPDLFLTTVRHGNRLYHNEGGGKFRDITVDAGVGYVGHSSGAVFFDYDGDGLLDLLVTNVGKYTSDVKGPGGYYVGLSDAFHGHTFPDRDEASILYHNLGGGRFRDVSAETGFRDVSWSGDATVIDANGDGRPDIYMLNMQGPDHLWLNVGGKRFVDASAKYFPRTPWGSMGVKAFDYNGDGRFDLYVTDMHSDMFTPIAPEDYTFETMKSDQQAMPDHYFPNGKGAFVFGNALFANRGTDWARKHGTPYEEVSDRAGVETYWPWGPSVDDINADGWDDILVINGMSFPYRYAPNSLLLNEGNGRFLDAAFTLGIEPRAHGETEQVWFTLDCGAKGKDAGSKNCGLCAGPDAAKLGCRKDGSGRYTMMASRSGRSAVILDIDGDGDLDIVTNEFNARPQVLVSDLAQRGQQHALSVRLRGTRSNRQGLGAEVTLVLADQRRVLKVMDGKSGYLSQSDLPLFFGLGKADHADHVEVRWPSGKVQSVAGPLAAGKVIEVTEP